MRSLVSSALLGVLLFTAPVALTGCSKSPGTQLLGVSSSQLDHTPAPAGTGPLVPPYMSTLSLTNSAPWTTRVSINGVDAGLLAPGATLHKTLYRQAARIDASYLNYSRSFDPPLVYVGIDAAGWRQFTQTAHIVRSGYGTFVYTSP